jgi:hypothetical protein
MDGVQHMEVADVAHASKEPGKTTKNPWTPGFALREESPRIVRHLADGCPTCNAGLQAFHRTGSDARLAASARERFERELAAGLAAAASPVQALHTALADLAVRRREELTHG